MTFAVHVSELGKANALPVPVKPFLIVKSENVSSKKFGKTHLYTMEGALEVRYQDAADARGESGETIFATKQAEVVALTPDTLHGRACSLPLSLPQQNNLFWIALDVADVVWVIAVLALNFRRA
jgi:hypothetical protein